MAKTPQSFYDQYNGQRIDFDGSYGVQCVDGFKVFCSWIGAPVRTTGNGYADGYWYNRNTNGYSKYFYFVSRNDLRNGDWVFWARGSGSHPHSHVAMYYNGKEFGENQGGNRQFRLINGHFGDALGGFRWKGWESETPAPKPQASTNTSSNKGSSSTATQKTETPKEEEKKEEEKKTEKVQKRITIADVNAGEDYLVSEAGVKLFGRISRVVTWDDIVTPKTLKEKAEVALNSAVNMAITIDVDAVDASLLDFSVQPLRLGERVPLDSPPHGLNTMLTLSKMSLPLDRPEDGRYTLGATFTAMTEQQVAQRREAYRVADTVRQISVSVNEITEEKATAQQDEVNRSAVWLEVEKGG